jgi:glycosyltransferase 2 family protein
MNKTKKNKRYIKSVIFCVVLIVITFYLILRSSEMNQLLDTIKNADPVYLIIGFILMLLFVTFEAFSIKILLKSFSYRPSFLKCIKYSFIGFYFSSITPTAGLQPAQIYYMKKDGIEIWESSLTILIVTVSYQVGMILLSIIMYSMRTTLIYTNLGILKYCLIFGLVINSFLIVIFICAVFQNNFLKRIFNGSIKLLSKLKIIKNPDSVINKAEIQLSEYKKGADYLRKTPRILLWVLAQRLMQILSRLSVAYAIYKAFGLSGYSYLDIIAMQTILAIAVESLPLPGAIGASEAGFLAINKIIFGADKLLPAMILSRGISYYAMLIISGGVTLGAHIFAGRHPAHKDVTHI